MGLLDALIGNASEAPVDKGVAKLAPLLAEGDRVERTRTFGRKVDAKVLLGLLDARMPG